MVCCVLFTMSSEVYSEAGGSSGDLRWRFGTRLLHLTVSFPLGIQWLWRLRTHGGFPQIPHGGDWQINCYRCFLVVTQRTWPFKLHLRADAHSQQTEGSDPGPSCTDTQWLGSAGIFYWGNKNCSDECVRDQLHNSQPEQGSIPSKEALLWNSGEKNTELMKLLICITNV